MIKHPHIVQLSEVRREEIKAPAGSVFGGRRQRGGAQIGARKLGYSFFAVPPGKAAFGRNLLRSGPDKGHERENTALSSVLSLRERKSEATNTKFRVNLYPRPLGEG